MILVLTMPLVFIWFPMWGSMFTGPREGATEEDYYVKVGAWQRLARHVCMTHAHLGEGWWLLAGQAQPVTPRPPVALRHHQHLTASPALPATSRSVRAGVDRRGGRLRSAPGLDALRH